MDKSELKVGDHVLYVVGNSRRGTEHLTTPHLVDSISGDYATINCIDEVCCFPKRSNSVYISRLRPVTDTNTEEV